jgi:glutamate-ammonia-ligase adenylyltransferase
MRAVTSDLAARLQALATAPPGARQGLVDAAPPEQELSLRALVHGPDPEGAVRRAASLPAAILAQGELAPRLCRLMHEGSYPARLLTLHPPAAEVLRAPVGAAPLSSDAIDLVLADAAASTLPDALGRLRTTEYVRLAAREIENAPIEEVGGDLCTLVTACVEACLRHEGIADRVCAMGMGKLGGDELNFLSDIDLVFVHSDALDRGQVVDLHDRLRRVVRALEGEGRWRPLFRVDLRLRPFGRRGPLSLSLQATESYYERHGRPWERQVWIRARPLAGELALGGTIIDRLRPFVYRRSVSPSIFAEIDELMERARREASTAVADDGAIDLKLDAGGIRQVEFAVQALQLLHGGRRPELRVASTLPALDRLFAAGLVSDREHRELADAYRFFRRVEHRVQLADGQQTHRVPADPEARALLARRLSATDPALDDFETSLSRARERVRRVAETLGGLPATTPDPRRRDITVVLDPGAPREVRCEALARLGLRDPDEAEALLSHMASRVDGPFVAAGPAREGADALVQACLDAADPDASIAGLAKFAEHRRAHYAVWRFFAEPASAPARKLAGELLGASDTLARGLIGFPVGRGALPDDAIDLLMGGVDAELPDLAGHAAALAEHPEDPRGVTATLLRFQHRQLTRIALHDLARRPDPLQVGRSLSDLADVVVERVMKELVRDSTDDGAPYDLAVIAMGKYGMQAMDYGSDLDLMFVFEGVHDHPGSDVQSRAIRAGQDLVARLSDRAIGPRLYEVDTRLRPSGRQGLLVTGLAGFRHYHGGALPVWERLANLRVRAIGQVRLGRAESRLEPEEPGPELAGSMAPGSLCARVLSIVHASLGFGDAPASAPEPAEIVRGVRDLLRRIEAEIAQENPAKGRYHAKSGAGGSLELELLVGALQLAHGPAHPEARSRGIVSALEGLARAGAVTERQARTLAADYRFLRLLLNRLRMSRVGPGEDPDRFLQNSPRLVTLARRMGLAGDRALLEEFHRCRADVRSAVLRRLDPHDPMALVRPPAP